MRNTFEVGDQVEVIANCACCLGLRAIVTGGITNRGTYMVKLEDGRIERYAPNQIVLVLTENASKQEEYLGEW